MADIGDYKNVAAGVGFVAGQIGKAVGGPWGQAYATVLTGQNTWAANTANLMSKVHDGTATPADFADLGMSSVSLLAAAGVLTGAAAPWVLIATGVASGALFLINNADTLRDIYDDPMGGLDKIKDMVKPNGGSSSAGSSSSGGAGGTNSGTGAAGGLGQGGANAGSSVTVPPRRDPLALDLDGDGIETTSSREGISVVFDHNGDGIKTGTGWLRPDDGWLVLDRNNDGVINSGRELFGVDTIKRDGISASDGFDALQELDTNGDRKITSTDDMFSRLAVWRDINQDGISQEHELSTLSEESIISIGLDSKSVRADLGNGNVLTAAGTFLRSSGEAGLAGETDPSAGNLDLLIDSFKREFSDQIPLTEQAAHLPTLRGSGMVRDLQEAVSVSTELGSLVREFLSEATRQGQIAKLDVLIKAWADTSTMQPLSVQASHLTAQGVTLTYQFATLAKGSIEYASMIEKIGIVERFMGMTYGGPTGQATFESLKATAGHVTVSLAQEQTDNVTLAYERFKTDIYESLLLKGRLKPYFDLLTLDIDEQGVRLDTSEIENAFETAIAARPRDGLIDLIEFVSAAGASRLQRLNWDATGFIAKQIIKAGPQNSFYEELSGYTVFFANDSAHTPRGTARSDIIVLGNGNNAITAGLGDDLLVGGNGTDTISGDAGADTLDGGSGAEYDFLLGGEGNDTYLIRKGSGFNDINDNGGSSSPGIDIVVMEGIASTEARFIRRGDHLYVNYGSAEQTGQYGVADQLGVANFFAGSAYRLEKFMFSDGTTLSDSDVQNKAVTYGDAAANTITGSSLGTNRIYGLAGNDTLTGGALEDLIDGGDDADSINGGAGSDLLLGGAGKDTINGDAGADTLDGGSGAEYDFLLGGEGNDTYLIRKGSGFNDINDNGGSSSPGIDIVVMEGIASTEARFIRRGDHLYVNYGSAEQTGQYGVADQLGVANFFAGSAYRLEKFMFSDGITLSDSDVQNKAVTYGDAAANTITGSSLGTNRIYGLAGNDTLTGGALEDLIDGGDDADSINGGAGSDLLLGGAGKDTINGDAGADTLDGGSGAEYDFLLGGEGNDTYLIRKGSGFNDINDNGGSSSPGIDIVVMEGIASTEARFIRRGDHLYVNYGSAEQTGQYGVADQLGVANFFAGSAYRLEKFMFSDGITLSDSDVQNKAVTYGDAAANTITGSSLGTNRIYGLAGNDTLTGGALEDLIDGGDDADSINGGAGSDLLLGGAGKDTINGDAGADTLDGGSGAEYDFLLGGEGNDTYLIRKGSGFNDINDNGGSSSPGIDIVVMEGIASTEARFIRRGDHLYVNYGSAEQTGQYGVADQLGVANFFAGSAYRLEKFMFSDGITLSDSDVQNKAVTYGDAAANTITGSSLGTNRIYGLAGNDTLTGGALGDLIDGGDDADSINGGAGSDLLLGGAGKDTINGDAGADTLDGGSGAEYDFLLGGEGNDTYLIRKGSGFNDINDNGGPSSPGIDIVVMEGIASTEARFIRRGDHLYVNYGSAEQTGQYGVADQLGVANFFAGSAYRLEKFMFSDGITLSDSDVQNKAVTYGDAAANTITGSSLGTNRIYGLAGNDTLTGGALEDLIDGGDDADSINGGAGSDLLLGGAGKDTINGDAGADTLDGGTDSDYDWLSGGTGSDVYVIRAGTGATDVYDYDPTTGSIDVVQFKDVASTAVTLMRKGDQLFVNYRIDSDPATGVEQLGILNYFADKAYRVEQLQFSDSVSWNEGMIGLHLQGSESVPLVGVSNAGIA
ncbi:calcium-binding protein [Massilia sp. YMA4]|uniref:calcium-binding protein n=1 Tax=Massilia sp. YMA4 TaxID=1593482 RepID=UPI001877E291|nr:calcium-binding protein [Massilia sp. YMA4]